MTKRNGSELELSILSSVIHFYISIVVVSFIVGVYEDAQRLRGFFEDNKAGESNPLSHFERSLCLPSQGTQLIILLLASCKTTLDDEDYSSIAHCAQVGPVLHWRIF